VGDRLRAFGPDVRGNAGLIRKALTHTSRVERETSPGVFASRRGLAEVLEAFPEPLVHLREEGKDIREVELPMDVGFVLSDSIELTGEEEATVSRRRMAVCSVGPRSLHTGDVIAIVHNELDRRHPR